MNISLHPQFHHTLGFFNVIIEAMNAGFNIFKMSVKQWYNFLVESDVTMITSNQGRILRKCRVENLYHLTAWENVWLNVRMPGLSNESKSFAWKLAHDLLPTEVRVNDASKIPSYVCKYSCPGDPVGNLEHCFSECKLT